MNFINYLQPAINTVLIGVIVWAIRLEVKIHATTGKLYYLELLNKEHYETNRGRLDAIDGNYNGLAKAVQDMVSMLAEIRTDFKWLKESITLDSFKK